MYCMLDYEFWSAPVNDLSDWSSKGVNYSSSQDPLSKKSNRRYMYAPDCVRGNDGKYYLYYCLSGDNGVGCYYGPISVAFAIHLMENINFMDMLNFLMEHFVRNMYHLIQLLSTIMVL